MWGLGKPIPWRQWRHADARHKGHHEQRCDTNSKRSGRDRSTSIQRICGGLAEHCIQQTTEWHLIINWRCSVHLKQSRGQEAKKKVASLKINCRPTLFSRFYIACQARQSNLDSFFEHENQACPPSISDIGQLRHGSKSDLMECLTKSSQPESIHPGIDAKVLDGAAIVHYGHARGLSSIWEVDLRQQMFLPYIISWLETASRVDLVWDRYLTDILKQSTRDRRTHSGNTSLQERLFRWTGMLSCGVMLTKINCFAICSIAYRLAKLADRWSSAQRMKRSSPHRMTWATSSISSTFPWGGRYAHSAPRCALCTTRTSQSDNPNRRHRCGCPCNRTFPGASAWWTLG